MAGSRISDFCGGWFNFDFLEEDFLADLAFEIPDFLDLADLFDVLAFFYLGVVTLPLSDGELYCELFAFIEI